MGRVKYSLLSYDIPDNSKAHGYPANRMRRELRQIAVDVNASDWVLKKRDTPYNRLAQMGADGMNWWLVDFDSDDIASLAARVTGALRKNIREQIEGMHKSIDKADAKLAAALKAAKAKDATTQQARRALALYRTQTGSAVRRLVQLLADCESATRALGFNLEGVPVEESRRIADSLQTSAHARAALYAAATAKLRAGESKRAALANQLPLFALADAIEEEGGDGQALRDLGLADEAAAAAAG